MPVERDRASGLDRAGGVVRFFSHDHHLLARLDRAVPYPPDRHPADVVVGREVRDEQLQRVAGRVDRRRRVLDQQLEQRSQVRAGDVEVRRRRAGLGVGEDDREIDLIGIRAQVEEELVDGVQDLFRTSVGAVDLVDGHDHREMPGHRLLEHVASLRQRALGGIHEEQDRIDHQETALDLAAEVGVAGRIHDVQADPVVVDGGLLGQDRDALLALQVAGVHDPLHDDLIGSKSAGLAKHRVHERGLAVVDMGHDGKVPDVGAIRRARRRRWAWRGSASHSWAAALSHSVAGRDAERHEPTRVNAAERR